MAPRMVWELPGVPSVGLGRYAVDLMLFVEHYREIISLQV